MKGHCINTDPRAMAFGRYLKAIRAQMGVPLREIACHIHVEEETIRRIEAEDHGHMPDAVRVKGILRAYAQYIGVDADDIIERYTLNRSVYLENNGRGGKKWLPVGKNWMRMSIPAGFLIIIVFLVYMVYESFLISFPFAGEKKPADSDSVEIPLAGEVLASDVTVDADDKMLLRIDAVENTWLRIIVDEEPPLEYSLHPMDHMEMAASAKIEMRIGNPRGVKVFLNEEPVAIAGETGQTVDVMLSHPH